MHIQLNGQPRQVEDAITIAQLLDHCGYAQRKVAVEVNQAIVPRSAHASHALAEGDTVEVVTAFGGG
ncbi:MAG: sulfur carrier protein ThiS [Proteobacteria bacterium]|nr:sulfur carrier protein ThiS [Pseudomonadota bacterium]